MLYEKNRSYSNGHKNAMSGFLKKTANVLYNGYSNYCITYLVTLK
jgi:hypothetical protein